MLIRRLLLAFVAGWFFNVVVNVEVVVDPLENFFARLSGLF